MGIEDIKQGKLLYHLTKLSNLDSILKHGLLSRKHINDNKIQFSDVADKDIISKRTRLGLDIYTPFHFHPYSSFDVAVKGTYPDEDFIYICILRTVAQHNRFKILPKHPLNMEECTLMEYEEGFKEIDWNTMHTKGINDNYTKQVKMAECLTRLIVPAKVFQCIYVKNNDIRPFVEKNLEDNGIVSKPPFVNLAKWL